MHRTGDLHGLRSGNPAILNVFADDVELHEPPGGAPPFTGVYRGRDGAGTFFQRLGETVDVVMAVRQTSQRAEGRHGGMRQGRNKDNRSKLCPVYHPSVMGNTPATLGRHTDSCYSGSPIGCSCDPPPSAGRAPASHTL